MNRAAIALRVSALCIAFFAIAPTLASARPNDGIFDHIHAYGTTANLSGVENGKFAGRIEITGLAYDSSGTLIAEGYVHGLYTPDSGSSSTLPYYPFTSNVAFVALDNRITYIRVDLDPLVLPPAGLIITLNPITIHLHDLGDGESVLAFFLRQLVIQVDSGAAAGDIEQTVVSMNYLMQAALNNLDVTAITSGGEFSGILSITRMRYVFPSSDNSITTPTLYIRGLLVGQVNGSGKVWADFVSPVTLTNDGGGDMTIQLEATSIGSSVSGVVFDPILTNVGDPSAQYNWLGFYLVQLADEIAGAASAWEIAHTAGIVDYLLKTE